jgi:predicted secreted protein
MNMSHRPFLAVAASLLIAPAAQADVLPPPQGVLNLNASASVEVPKDLLAVTFSVTREGPDATTVQTALKQALDAALTEARRIAKPGQVDVRAGGFSIFPRYSNKGGITNWQGNTELVVEGRDMGAIAQLTGRVQTMSIGRVAYTLSREAREKVEAEVSAMAVARYRAQAAEMAKAFGYSGYTIREVNVTLNEPPGGPVPMMRASKMSAMADDSLPTEPGKGTVTATVGGTVQMTK